MCVRAAYVDTFVTPHYDHFNVDNTSFFDSIESVLLDTVDIVTGCEIILCGDFNARTADGSCVTKMMKMTRNMCLNMNVGLGTRKQTSSVIRC